jgi:Tol biopolymer transport system component
VPSAGLPPPPGTTTLVSERFRGGFAGGGSAEASISENGRWVAFTSGAADLVAGDANGALDVFVRDRRTGKTTRLLLPNGSPIPAGGRASQPSISADGAVVAFTYQPAAAAGTTGVIPGTIVLAWDRRSNDVEVVSRTVKGTAAPGSRQPSVSGDGRYVAFTSDHAGVVAGDRNASPDVFRYDRRRGTSVMVSVGFEGQPVPGNHGDPSISGNGNLVAFVSDAGDAIIDENTGSGSQVYVRDIAGWTERVSGALGGGKGGGPADGAAVAPSISGDGRYVAFDSAATNLVSGDGNGSPDVFRRDRQSGVTELVSVTPDGSPAKGASGQASITRDGRMVAFTSAAPDLVAGLPGAHLAAVFRGATEVYIRDLVARDTVLVSVGSDGEPGGGASSGPSVGGSGRYVAFAANSDRLVAGDDNRMLDVFLRDMPPLPTLNPAVVDFGSRAVGSPPTPGAAVLANAGWGPMTVTGAGVTGTAKAEFPVTADSCTGTVLYRGTACTVTVSFSPAKAGARTATLQIADNQAGSPRTARLRGTGSKARLELDPPVGQPGTVVVATGTGFPPGAQVRLSWSRGMTPKLPTVTADAKGGFRVQVLVFHHDMLGPRDLEAVQVGAVPFPPVAAPMLVSAPSAMPPGFTALYRFVDIPLVLVIRG